MPSRPWYKWYPGDYLADTMHLSLEADAVYRRVLDALWTHGPLPDDPRQLSRILRLDPRQLRRIFAEVRPHLRVSNGLVDHPKMAEQRTQDHEFSEKQRERVRKRWDTAGNTRARVPDPDPDLVDRSRRSVTTEAKPRINGNHQAKPSPVDRVRKSIAERDADRAADGYVVDQDGRPFRSGVDH